MSARHRDDSDARDERVAELVDDYLRRLRVGEEIAPEDFARAHPDCESDLLEILPSMRALADLGDGDPSESSTEATGTGSVEGWRLGDYMLRRELGRGGMGVVYEAWQGSMGRRVALKVLPTGAAADSRAWENPPTAARPPRTSTSVEATGPLPQERERARKQTVPSVAGEPDAGTSDGRPDTSRTSRPQVPSTRPTTRGAPARRIFPAQQPSGRSE